MKNDTQKRKAFLLPALILVVILMVGSARIAAAVHSEPIDQIKETVDEILVILREDASQGEADWDEKKKRIIDVVENRFDFNEMSKLSLASHWKKRTPEEKASFVGLFSKMLENTYINRIKDYSDEEVLFKGQEIKHDKAVVHSVIVKNNAEIPISYKLKNDSDKWMVYDVIIEGVSLVRNYRSQFMSIIGKEKYAGLIKRMEAKIETIENAQ